MNITATILISIGIIIFLIGYWFLGKSRGESECKDKPDSLDRNYGGGIAGIVIGIILMLVGLIMNLTNSPTTPSYSE
jgi:hypothetical protein